MSAPLEELKKKWRAPFSFLPAPYLGFEIADLEIIFNPKMRSRAGVCKIRYRRFRFRSEIEGTIELNPHLLTTTALLEEVLVHELCHFVVGKRWPRAEPHGSKWRALMEIMGFEPKRCHALVPLKQNHQKRWSLQCRCRVHEVTTVIFNRVQSGKGYKCRDCGQLLSA